MHTPPINALQKRLSNKRPLPLLIHVSSAKPSWQGFTVNMFIYTNFYNISVRKG